MELHPREFWSESRGLRACACTLAALASLACGSNDGAPNPVPSLTSISPSTITREAPAFTLTVSGRGFVPGSSVRWNGFPRPTTFVSQTELTSAIAAGDTLVAGSYDITVLNPAPGGGASNTVPFSIPCVLPAPTAAANQQMARLGAYYFDGWAGELSNFHFDGLLDGGFRDREPLSGWRDNSACAVEQQLAWARSFGIDFFLFDWYFNVLAFEDDNLNSALQITHSLPDRHGMQYAILYVDAPPFTIDNQADWSSAVDEWVGYMTDPAYVRVNGKPLFVVIDYLAMRTAFGSSVATNAAFAQLRSAAVAHGLAGVYVVAGFGVGSAGQDGVFPDLSSVGADGYDAVTTYNYPDGPGRTGELPFSELADAGRWIWTQAAAASPLPVIPVAMDGWDNRPWTPKTNLWYDRSPAAVAAFVGDLIAIAESSPRVRLEPSPAPPLVLMEAWNELGEGSFILPTKEDGTSYGDALAAALALPSTRLRSVLTLAETGPSDPQRSVRGSLRDSMGAANPGAIVTLSATPLDGPGFYAEYRLAGTVPSTAETAVVGFRVNVEGGGPATSNFALYQASYMQDADGLERVPNGDFSSGTQSWAFSGPVQLLPSDHGAGNMLLVQAPPNQAAALTSSPFAVAANTTFSISFASRVAPSSFGSGYFMLIFEKAGIEFLREEIPLKAAPGPLGSATTDGSGNYSLGITSLGGERVVLEADYVGDAQHWPAYARVGD